MINFKQKLEEQFKSFNISALNETKNCYHLYADYVELICLCTNDYISPSDIIDRLNDSGIQFSLEEEKLDGEIGSRETEVNDTQEKWVNIIFDLLRERIVIFGDSYPFIIDKQGIKLINGHKKSIQLFYIFLLISSSLKDFKKVQNFLTNDFESLSEKVLKEYLPKKALTKAFGVNTKYKGNAKTKILTLAKELNIDTKDRYIEQISEKNSKEEGLDIIGWIPFEDKNPNSIIILGQCACGKEWKNKQFETRRYENFLEFYKQPFIHALFLPFAFSNKGRFEQDKDITNNILIFERRRILEYLRESKFDNSFKSKQIVEKCLNCQEDIV